MDSNNLTHATTLEMYREVAPMIAAIAANMPRGTARGLLLESADVCNAMIAAMEQQQRILLNHPHAHDAIYPQCSAAQQRT